MVYLNHAATTYPKPKQVMDSVARAIAGVPQSQYRSILPDDEGQDIMRLCRGNLARLFGIREPERIFFTSGSTQALNTAILGFRSGRTGLVITQTEHNAVLRTVYDGLSKQLEDGTYRLTVVSCDGSGYINMEEMEEAITDDTALVIVNHCSNVTGALQDIGQIGEWAAQKGACFLVDASQSAGTLPIDVEQMKIDMLAFTGHKGLFGIQGSGGLYVRSGISLRPLCFGGTGTDSRIMIPETPYYEVGTANIPGIAGMNAGAEWILQTGPDVIREKERELMKQLYEGLRACSGVTVYAERQPEGTALSFNLRGLAPADVGYILAGTYQIAVRTGLHCSPLIHKALNTEALGTVRVSISYMTAREEIAWFLKAIQELALA